MRPYPTERRHNPRGCVALSRGCCAFKRAVAGRASSRTLELELPLPHEHTSCELSIIIYEQAMSYLYRDYYRHGVARSASTEPKSKIKQKRQHADAGGVVGVKGQGAP
jgi:hypothetical protein